MVVCTAMSFRTDKDSLGQVSVPADAYYGPFTARAMEQYKVTGQKAHINLVRSYVMIKRSAALANRELGGIEASKADAIVRACDEILGGRLIEQFVVEAINSGAGTAFNMNANEVIANRALEILGKQKGMYDIISPNDDVNKSQSSNDTFPTAMNVSILLGLKDVLAAIDKLTASLDRKAVEFAQVIKIGRTHLMDAIPVTLGAEFAQYSYAIKRARAGLEQAAEGLRYVGLGGTAVGTGANAAKGYRELAISHLAKASGLDLKPSENMFYSLQSKYDVANCSSALRNLAIELTKMANDIRLMASGPTAGLAEILIPAVHAGSSIMPGKVNPSLAECLDMICFNVIGNDVSVAMAAQAGQFELNVMLPGMLKCLLDSADMLKNFLPIFAGNLVDGIRANRDKLESYVEKSPVLVTLLNPHIGYMKAAEIYKESLKTGKSVRDLVLERKLMTKEQLEAAFSRDSILGSG
jgi:aspartate ammonia-lyase